MKSVEQYTGKLRVRCAFSLLACLVFVVGCGDENGETQTGNDDGPACVGAEWVRFDRVQKDVEIPLLLDEGASAELAWAMGETDTPSSRYRKTESVWFETSGLQTIFVRTIGADCRTVTEARVINVLDTYPGIAGSQDTDAVSKDDPGLIAWATGWEMSNRYGPNVSATWQTPERALGEATGRPADVVSLGDGGHIDLLFEVLISDGPGPDFAVFENSFSDTFLELAMVAVSSDGVEFVFFPTVYLGEEVVDEYGDHEPEAFDGFAGRYRAGFGTPFDLKALHTDEAVLSGRVDLDAISTVRIVDVVGDGRIKDALENPIFDPYPTQDSGGFDLDAVGVFNALTE